MTLTISWARLYPSGPTSSMSALYDHDSGTQSEKMNLRLLLASLGF